jgi:hypothetical protein
MIPASPVALMMSEMENTADHLIVIGTQRHVGIFAR